MTHRTCMSIHLLKVSGYGGIMQWAMEINYRPTEADWKKLCVSGNPTNPTKRGPTLNIFFFFFFFHILKSHFSHLFNGKMAFYLGYLMFSEAKLPQNKNYESISIKEPLRGIFKMTEVYFYSYLIPNQKKNLI